MVNQDYDCAADLLGRIGLMRGVGFDAVGEVIGVISSVPGDFSAGRVVFAMRCGLVVELDLSEFAMD